MDRKFIRNYQIISIIVTFILGSLLHFTYDLSGENGFVGIFSSVNESVWEHLKLLYFPMVLTTIFGMFYIGKKVPNFLCSKTIGIALAMTFLVVFHYTYAGIIGKNISIIDIASFFLATILGELVAYILMMNNFQCNYKKAKIVLLILFVCFAVFTYITPHLGIFRDPVTGEYGIIK